MFWKTEKVDVDFPGVTGYVRVVPLNWLPTGRSTAIFTALGEAAGDRAMSDDNFTMSQATRMMGAFMPYLADVIATWDINLVVDPDDNTNGVMPSEMKPADIGNPSQEEKRVFVEGLPFGIAQLIFEKVMAQQDTEEGSGSTIPLPSASS